MTSTKPRGQFLLVGPWNEAEFAIVRESLTTGATVTDVPDCETASGILARDEIIPDLILLAQPLPETYRQNEIGQLRRAAPLAQLVVVAGTWCEGELRTGTPLVGVPRMYWYELMTCWQTMGHGSSWSFGLDGPLSPRYVEAVNRISLTAPIAVHASSLASFEAIADSMQEYGIKCCLCREARSMPKQVAAGIWDGAQLDASEFALLKDFATSIHDHKSSLIVLLDFPRKEHYSKLNKLACRAIFGKPFIVAELAAACGLAGATPHQSSSAVRTISRFHSGS